MKNIDSLKAVWFGAPCRIMRGCLPILTVLLVISSCVEDKREWTNEPSDKRPSAIIQGFDLTSTIRGKKQWEFHSEKARLFREQKMILAETIRVDYFSDDKIVSTLTSKECKLNVETHDTLAYGNVKLVTERGEVLYTEELEWKADEEKIYTDKPVTVIYGKNVIYAEGLKADANLRKMEFMKKGSMEIKDVEEVDKLRH